jgi:hypothetical protein
MTFIPPTPVDIKARFPEFTAVADATIDLFIEEAACVMGNWGCDCTQLLSYRYLVAGLLSSEGYPMRLSLPPSLSGAMGGASGATSLENPTQYVELYKVGDVSIKYAQANAGSASSGGGGGSATPKMFSGNAYLEKFWAFKKQQIPMGFVMNGSGGCLC